MTADDQRQFDALAAAYREKFGEPFPVALFREERLLEAVGVALAQANPVREPAGVSV